MIKPRPHTEVSALLTLGRRRTAHPALGLVIRVGGSAAILVALFHFLPIGQVWSTLRRMPASLWVLVLCGYLASHLVGVGKWRLMVNLAGAGLSFPQAGRCYFAGLFSTLFLPSIVGGDVVRAGLALSFGRSKAGVLLGSFIDRLIDIGALLLIAGFGALLAPQAVTPRARLVFEVAGACALLLAGAILLLVVLVPARRLSLGMRRHAVRMRSAARAMRRRPGNLAMALALGIVVQGAFIWLTATLAAAGGLSLAARAWIFAWPLAKIAAVLPITQGGIGIREAALAALLAPFGAPAAAIVGVGLAWEAVIIAGGLVAGVASMALGRRLAVRPRRAAYL